MKTVLSAVRFPEGAVLRSDTCPEGTVGSAIAHQSLIFVAAHRRQKVNISVGGEDGILIKPSTPIFVLPPDMLWKVEVLSKAQKVSVSYPFRAGQFAVCSGGDSGLIVESNKERPGEYAHCLNLETLKLFDIIDTHAWAFDTWRLHGYAKPSDQVPLVVVHNTDA